MWSYIELICVQRPRFEGFGTVVDIATPMVSMLPVVSSSTVRCEVVTQKSSSATGSPGTASSP